MVRVPLAVVSALVVALSVGSTTGVGRAAVLPAPQLQAQAVAPPVAVAPVAGGVAREFAPPPTPYSAGHRGVDLVARPGAVVVAALAGVVTFSGSVARVGWVTVDHGGGLATTYGPLDPRLVSAGDHVAAGGVLGLIAADGDHLDWGARRDGTYIDPMSLLQPWEVHLTDEAPLGPATAAGGVVAGARVAGARVTPVAGRVSSGFGMRTHPVTGERRLHAGLDFAAPTGRPVVAAAAGTVSAAADSGGYGLLVTVDHGAGVTTRYAHLSRIAVSVGDPVAAGTVVGAVGSTGQSTGPHLHFEVRVGGVPRDPLDWLAA